MLTINPSKRITAAEALKHPWICVRVLHARAAIKETICDRRLPPPLILESSHLPPAATVHCSLHDAQAGDRGVPEEIQRQKETQGEVSCSTFSSGRNSPSPHSPCPSPKTSRAN